jgi:ketosteroid isomerase-like protein
LVASFFVLGIPAYAASQNAQTQEVIQVVEAFHASLAAGDSATALSLLAADATILESGGMEDREHYRSGHLASDIRFAQAVRRERGDIQVEIVGDVAWAYSTDVSRGRMGEREIDSRGAELMVLTREDAAWIIRAIHWSSRSQR